MAVIINEFEVVLDESESGSAAGPGGAGAGGGADGAATQGATPGMARRLTPLDLEHIARRRDELASRLYAG